MMSSLQAQIVVLAAQILWSEDVEAALHQISAAGDQKFTPLERVLSQVETTLNVLADSVLQEQPPLRRRKLEHLVMLIAIQRMQLLKLKITQNAFLFQM
jgi:dynein heavy chain 1